MTKKTFTVLAGIVLGLVLIEIILRFFGFGYNIIYKPPKKLNADYRIFCVGESTTWGIGTKDHLNDGYPKQLENLLNRHFPDLEIQCLLDRTIGQNTSEILLKLPNYIKKYQPHLIILMVEANNWWNLDRSNALLFNEKKL